METILKVFNQQPMSKKALDKSKNIAKLITDALGGLGIFGVELFVKKDDVWFFRSQPKTT